MFRIQIEESFHLEPLHLKHAIELFELTNKNRDRLREWLPWLDKTNQVEDTIQFIKTAMNQYTNTKGYNVVLIFQNQIVGICGFHHFNNEHRHGEIGYWLSKDYEGWGLMTKAVLKIIELGFREFNLNKISMNCATGNKKSKSVAERLGFKQDGILRQNEWLYDHFVDHIVYSLLKVEFESR